MNHTEMQIDDQDHHDDDNDNDVVVVDDDDDDDHDEKIIVLVEPPITATESPILLSPQPSIDNIETHFQIASQLLRRTLALHAHSLALGELFADVAHAQPTHIALWFRSLPRAHPLWLWCVELATAAAPHSAEQAAEHVRALTKRLLQPQFIESVLARGSVVPLIDDNVSAMLGGSAVLWFDVDSRRIVGVRTDAHLVAARFEALLLAQNSDDSVSFLSIEDVLLADLQAQRHFFVDLLRLPDATVRAVCAPQSADRQLIDALVSRIVALIGEAESWRIRARQTSTSPAWIVERTPLTDMVRLRLSQLVTIVDERTSNDAGARELRRVQAKFAPRRNRWCALAPLIDALHRATCADELAPVDRREFEAASLVSLQQSAWIKLRGDDEVMVLSRSGEICARLDALFDGRVLYDDAIVRDVLQSMSAAVATDDDSGDASRTDELRDSAVVRFARFRGSVPVHAVLDDAQLRSMRVDVAELLDAHAEHSTGIGARLRVTADRRIERVDNFLLDLGDAEIDKQAELLAAVRLIACALAECATDEPFASDVKRLADAHALLSVPFDALDLALQVRQRQYLAAKPKQSEREMIRVDASESGGKDSFRFMSWNVLAQTMLERTSGVRWSIDRLCAIAWRRFRLPTMCKTIATVDADVVCLQEVQVVRGATPRAPLSESHEADWRHAFEERGFAFHCVPRSRVGATLGVAIAWRDAQWRECERGGLTLGGASLNDAERRLHATERLAAAGDRGASHVVAWTRLQHRERSQQVLVVSAHLSPQSGVPGAALRLYQAIVLWRFVQQQRHRHRALGVLMLGDFNARPSEPAYALLTGGIAAALSHTLLDQEPALFGGLRQWLGELLPARDDTGRFESAQRRALGDEPLTTFTDDFTACIDYCFVDGAVVRTRSVVAPPGSAPLYPMYDRLSDHVWLSGALSLVASTPRPAATPPVQTSAASSTAAPAATEWTFGGAKTLAVTKDAATKTRCDAVVCPSNEMLAMTSGIAAQLSAAVGGSVVRDECLALLHERGKLSVGACVVTSGGGKLVSKWIIHAVPPTKLQSNRQLMLRETLRAVLRKAERKGATSIAIPLLTSGAYGMDRIEVIETMVPVVVEHLRGQQQQKRSKKSGAGGSLVRIELLSDSNDTHAALIESIEMYGVQ